MRIRHFDWITAGAMIAVAACGGQGELEPAASASHDVTAGAASSLAATAVSTGEIDLAWQQGSTQVSGWQVDRSGSASGTYTLVATVAAGTSTYADVGLSASTSYCYRVRSWVTSGRKTVYSSYVGPACATTLAPPPPPPPITAPSAVSVVPHRYDFAVSFDSGLLVTWRDNSDNEDGFRLQSASSASGPWTQAATTAAGTTSLLLSGLREQPVCFRVLAFNSSATSAPSGEACTTPPANPTNLSAIATAAGIDLAWTDNSAVEDGCRVSRQDASGTWTDIAALPANATRYSDAAIISNATYVYRVQALKDGGESDYSNLAAAVLPTAVPAAPTALGAVLYTDYDGDGWLFLSMWWTDASTNEAGFRIEWSDDGVTGWNLVSTTPANQPSFSDKYDLWSLAGSPISLCYRLIAFNALGDSAPSDPFCTGWGETPQDLVASGVDRQSIDLTWADAARYESGYDVYRSMDPQASGWDLVATLPADATSYHDTGLAAAQQYWYIVATAYPDAWYDDQYNQAWTCAATLP